MIPEAWLKRLGAFLRSVIPADPAQLLFLAGIVCLVFAPRMSWWPPQLNAFLSHFGIQDQQVRFESAPFIVLGIWAILFSAMAGYFVCFWPGNRQVRRVIFLVLLPVVAAICITFGRFAYVGRPYSSLLDKSILGNPIRSAQWMWWTSTPGFHLAFAGLLLVGIFTSRMMFGIASLPLALPEASVTQPSDSQFWGRIQFLIWVLVGPLFLSAAIPGAVIAAIAFGLTSRPSVFIQSPLFVRSSSLLEAMIFLGIVCWIAGKGGREVMTGSIRLSRPKYLFLALTFSIGIALLISTGQYLLYRLVWASQFGNAPPPQLVSYFNFPNPWLLLMFFGASFEEVVFRGLLQTTFVRRYGVYRGIFLTAIVWAAYHFNSDAFSHPTEEGVLSKLGFRLAICLALGFVLSWLALRSGSVLPAAVAHTFYNVLVSDFGPPFQGKSIVCVGLWAVLACWLFRYWPVQVANELAAEIPGAEPGIAV